MIYTPAPGNPYPRLRRFAIDLAITQVFNLIIAVLITYVVRGHGGFFINLVFSICIGTLATAFIDGGRLVLWGECKPPKWKFIGLILFSLPAAQFIGKAAAAAMLGIPREALSAIRSGNATAMLIGGAVSSMFIIWFFWSREHIEYLRAEAEAEKARAASIEKQALQAQLQMLQAQIEPHMLFNTLANLQGLIALDPPRAQHMLDQLIQYLRATLSASRAGQTTLAQEFALLDAYLGLMKIRMGARLSYALELPDDLRTVTLPPMLLQPLVENAIKHGLEPKVEGGLVTVRAEREDGRLVLTVCDTGLGLDGAPPSDGTGIGASNVRERLQALYGKRAEFSLTPNTPEGVIAKLTLPT
ncbi:sensor histidine kinase [Noviherbaspirillum denitrificans]|uniref:Histidine kinase n=1 Tax=Noviherbaspirillum denitrificans TaxID=1968433 RepID=A0A254TSF2_9BURK|nr:histidine kinase [Noviherbaspirillum denitrificans]OWW22658.1 histidine kinase [Noviherbaspirillum denitrificans]